MRSIVNLSLPAETVKMIKREVKKNKYVSISEFFRALLRDYEKDKLLSNIEESRREIAAGKGKVLHSFKDLE